MVGIRTTNPAEPAYSDDFFAGFESDLELDPDSDFELDPESDLEPDSELELFSLLDSESPLLFAEPFFA